jgi:hypothetical protein
MAIPDAVPSNAKPTIRCCGFRGVRSDTNRGAHGSVVSDVSARIRPWLVPTKTIVPSKVPIAVISSVPLRVI